MGKRSQRSRKRPRSPQPAEPSLPPPPRSIPGFVWDAEKQRYFPATGRSANSSAQRDELRETRRVQQIEQIQTQQARSPPPTDHYYYFAPPVALPLFVRRRSASQVPTLGLDYLRFACLSRATPHTFNTNGGQSVVSAAAITADSQHAVIGHRNGSLWRAKLDSDNVHLEPPPAVAMSGGPGEVVSIRRFGNSTIAAYMGDEHSGGGMVAILGSSRLRYADCSVLTASSLPTSGPPLHTAVGLTGRVSVATISNASMAESFTAQTKTDIMSTAFVIDSPHVFAGGGRDGRVRLFDTRVASAHHDRKRGLLSLALQSKSSIHGIGAHGWRLVAASMDSGVRMWDIRMPVDDDSQQQRRPLSPYGASTCFGDDLHSPLQVLSAARLGFAVCQGFVAAAGSDNQVRVWSMDTGCMLKTIALPPSAAACTALDLVLSPATGLPTLLYSHASTTVAVSAS
ncbi:hypothetical protein GGI21_001663 [Coemansia aciculifera]|uniref:Uncharacterized protein n=1 Tax=Coemansia aciculifera TaxID=417176 RepID=A0ACC1LX13_9FUNG|nr:hypothetical protein IWW38_004791 [Coemansia aciculifera]KAJ2909656.1 hypothetical protein GGI21_001663 [Coemansia aciculifera]